MPVFTNYLKKESEFIRYGLELLQAYRSDFDHNTKVAPEDLRIATFAMQLILENSHLTKEEEILIPALKSADAWSELNPDDHKRIEKFCNQQNSIRKKMLELRKSIDDYERDRNDIKMVFWRLNEFINETDDYLKDENNFLFVCMKKLLDPKDQKSLLQQAEKLDAIKGLGDMNGPRTIFNRLRVSKGMSAA